MGLDRLRRVHRALGSPQPAPTVITVAGTNGKGSTVAWLEQFSSALGLRHASFTSPHLDHFSERIRLQGQAVDDRRLVAAFERIDAARGDTSLTYFEIATLAALTIMAEHDLQLAILEVGLGGRLDAVNLIDADVAIVTSIALDHTEWLGDTLDDIGREKAGIFRPHQTAIFAGENPPESIGEVAHALGTRLLRAGEDYHIDQPHAAEWDFSHGSLHLAALPAPTPSSAIQMRNAAAALMALHAAGHQGALNVETVSGAIRSMHHPGRFEQVADDPAVVVDVAHNPAAAVVLADSIAHWKAEHADPDQPPRCIHLIMATLADKDAGGMIDALLPVVDFWYPCEHSRQAAGTRWQSADRLVSLLRDRQGAACMIASEGLDEALQLATSRAHGRDLVVCCGSFVTAARCRALIRAAV